MTNGLDTLTDKEKQTLRLILRGHDAKSSAQELGLSVHTVNERLRDARRKLGVTSSRAAARLLLAEESPDTADIPPENLGDKPLGDALARPRAAGKPPSASPRRAGPGLALTLAGVLAMSLILAALLVPASPLSVLPLANAGSVSATEPSAAAAPPQGAAVDLDRLQETARAWLAHIDKGDWQASYAASGSAFRNAISSPAWAQAAAQARQPLGSVIRRELLEYQSLSAPREQRSIIFRTDFANRAAATETVTLERDDGAYRVVGYWIK